MKYIIENKTDKLAEFEVFNIIYHNVLDNIDKMGNKDKFTIIKDCKEYKLNILFRPEYCGYKITIVEMIR